MTDIKEMAARHDQTRSERDELLKKYEETQDPNVLKEAIKVLDEFCRTVLEEIAAVTVAVSREARARLQQDIVLTGLIECLSRRGALSKEDLSDEMDKVVSSLQGKKEESSIIQP